MKINEVCKLTGLTKRVIDYYEHKQIINPAMIKLSPLYEKYYHRFYISI